jgi:hypothetical protein
LPYTFGIDELTREVLLLGVNRTGTWLFFDIVPYGMQTQEYPFPSPPRNMLRYTAIEEAIRLARSSGMTKVEIVRALGGSTPYSEAMKIAKRAAPILGLTVKAFMELRRNR